ncbi:MAG: M28 family peptidase [Chitinophagaceae bacterium]
MIKQITTILILIFPLLSASQKKDKNAIKAAASITTADLKKHLYIIASKEMEGRDTPSPGLEKAASYIEEHFKKTGLTPGNNGNYRQYYSLYRETMKEATMVINGEKLSLHADFQPIPGCYTAAMRFSEFIFAGFGINDGEIRNDYKDLNVAGKLVMIVDGIPSDYKTSTPGFNSPASLNGKLAAAQRLGASGILIVYNNFPRRPFSLSEGRWSTNGYKSSQSLFGFTVSTDIAAKLLKEYSKTMMEKVKNGSIEKKTYIAEAELSYTTQTETQKASNVIAVVEGTDLKDEYVFITSHYDHLGKRDTVVYYGADDDGSGTTAILEIAEAFDKAKKAGNGPRRSIVFMTVSGEEKGLWGSGYYASHPIYPFDKTTVDLNIDMIGRADASRKQGDSMNYVYVVGDDKLSSDLKLISEGVNKLYTKMELDYKFNDPNDPNRIYYRSDHYNFVQKGVPIIFYYDGMLKADYHKPTDTQDKIYYELMAKRTQLVFYTAWEMANRNEMLKRDIKLELPKGF